MVARGVGTNPKKIVRFEHQQHNVYGNWLNHEQYRAREAVRVQLARGQDNRWDCKKWRRKDGDEAHLTKKGEQFQQQQQLLQQECPERTFDCTTRENRISLAKLKGKGPYDHVHDDAKNHKDNGERNCFLRTNFSKMTPPRCDNTYHSSADAYGDYDCVLQ